MVAPPFPSRSRAVGAGLIATGEPYLQGQLDGLCGLYSAINAIAALTRPRQPLRGAHATRLFRCGITHIAQRLPLDEALRDGMGPEVWLSTIDRLIELAVELTGIGMLVDLPFAAKRAPQIATLHASIEAALDEGAVVLVSLAGVYDHYTVIHAHTASRFLLHDSFGLQSLMKRSCGSARSSRRHRIEAQLVTVLRRADAPSPRAKVRSCPSTWCNFGCGTGLHRSGGLGCNL